MTARKDEAGISYSPRFRILRTRYVSIGRDIGIRVEDRLQQLMTVDNEKGVGFKRKWIDVPIVCVDAGEEPPE